MALPWLRRNAVRQDDAAAGAKSAGGPTATLDRPRALSLTPEVWTVVAPDRLVDETRASFRASVVELIAHAAAARASEVTIDLAHTDDVDASGLGILVLAQRRAREHQMTVRLVNVRPVVRQLMELTRLDFLFHIVA